MKTWHMTLIGGLFVFMAILAIGCGGNSQMTVSEFVKRAYELDAQHEKAAEPLRSQFDAATANLAPTDKLPAGVTNTLTKLFDGEDRFAGEIEGMDAPREAKEIQTEAVASLKADAAYGRKAMDAIGKEATLGDLNTALENDEAAAVYARRENACKSMQKLADDNGIDVDMTC